MGDALGLGKLGRKVRCRFKEDVECMGLVNGKKLCYMDETTEEQFYEKHEMQFMYCPLLPEVEKVAIMAAMKKEGFTISRRWKG